MKKISISMMLMMCMLGSTYSFAATTSSAEKGSADSKKELTLVKGSFNEDALNITAILNDKKGQSYFKPLSFKLHDQNAKNAAYNLGRISNTFPIGTMVYRESLVNKEDAGWHKVPSPHGRLIIYITGKYKITTGSPDHPESRIFTGGDILYFNDQSGYGHVTQVLEKGVALMYDFSAPIPSHVKEDSE